MFKTNHAHRQQSLISTVMNLPKTLQAKLQSSWAGVFYKRIFSKIDESKFSVLFSEKKSRANFPINIYVGLEIMKQLFNWSDEEMIAKFHFDLQVCYAVGLENLGEKSVAPRTIYYNRQRIVRHEEQTGVNLFEEVFKEMTDEALQELGLDTSSQRMDSSLISSNIKKMSRLELSIKVLQNFYPSLSESEQNKHREKLKDYLNREADTITFHLKSSDVEAELKKVGELLLYFQTIYRDDQQINQTKPFLHVARVLEEQFQIVEDNDEAVELKPPEEIGSNSLQNPADDEATFRRKRNEDHHGYVFNISETCSKDNEVQLITDVSLHTNNTSDEKILQERIESLNERTKLDECIVDGGYSGEDSENACEENGIDIIFTGIKGAKVSAEKFALHNFELNETGVEACPKGHQPISRTYNQSTGRHVVHFDKEVCDQCPLKEKCCIQINKTVASLYFDDQQLRVAKKRQQFTSEIYRQKQRLRPAIEGTISLFKRRAYHGKVRVRGSSRVRNTVICMALAINFRRIAAALEKIGDLLPFFVAKLKGVLPKILGFTIKRLFTPLSLSSSGLAVAA